MEKPVFKDLIDWHGCDAVQFNPNKLSGRATVGATRMDADGVLIHHEGGMTIDEIAESFGVDKGLLRRFFVLPQPDGGRQSLKGAARPQRAFTVGSPLA